MHTATYLIFQPEKLSTLVRLPEGWILLLRLVQVTLLELLVIVPQHQMLFTLIRHQHGWNYNVYIYKSHWCCIR